MNRPDQSNIYLTWLAEGGEAPISASLPDAQKAITWLKKEHNKTYRLLMQKFSLKTLHRFMLINEDLSAFRQHLSNQSDTCYNLNQEQIKEMIQQTKNWQNSWCLRVSENERNVLKNYIHSLENKSPERVWLEYYLDTLPIENDNTKALAKLEKRLENLQNKIKKQENDFLFKEKSSLNLHFVKKPTGVSKETLKHGRKAAKKNGMTGYLFEFGTEAYEFLYGHSVENLSIREKAWKASEHCCIEPKDIDLARRLRNEINILSSEENNSFIQSKLKKSMISDLGSLTRPLETGLKSIRALSSKTKQAAYKKANNKKIVEKENAEAPWNFHLNEPYLEGNKPSIEGVFPWKETSLKLIDKILVCNGWNQIEKMKVKGGGKWVKYSLLVEKNGRKFQLLYSPFRPKEKGYSYSAASAESIRSTWLNGDPNGKIGVVRIELGLSHDTEDLELVDLRYIAHEMGHLIHYMQLPNVHPEPFQEIPNDLYEIPSYMMELFVKDPKVLVALASKKGPEKARRERYWEHRIGKRNQEVVHVQSGLLFALNDLILNSEIDRPILDVVQTNHIKFGVPFDVECGDWKRNYIWEPSLAAADFQQQFPDGLARLLIPTNHYDCAAHETVVAIYQDLLNNVLCRPGCFELKKYKQNWKHWAGMPFEQSYALSIQKKINIAKRLAQKKLESIKI